MKIKKTDESLLEHILVDTFKKCFIKDFHIVNHFHIEGKKCQMPQHFNEADT